MTTYYNDNDEFVCRWLRNLISAGHLPHGKVDCQSIRWCKPNEITQYTQAHFFAGIGGWAYALQLAGWPSDRPVWTGSPPCQDFSVAASITGNRKGLDGSRGRCCSTWLDLVAAVRPPVIFFENVPGVRPWITEIKRRLEDIGYTVSERVITAASATAPHIRRRLYLVADSNSKRLAESGTKEPSSTICNPWRAINRNVRVSDIKHTGLLDNGIPGRVGKLRAYGNAIVPQVAAAFVRAYMEDDQCQATTT